LSLDWADALGGPVGTAALAVVPAALLAAALRGRIIADGDRRWLVVLAAGLLATGIPRAAFWGAAIPFQWPAQLWAAPLDRLASAVGLACLGLMAVPPRARALRASFLVAALASAIGWLGWLAMQPVAAAAPPPQATAAWDVGLAVLGALAAAALSRGPWPAPRWMVATVGVLAAGSLVDALSAFGPSTPGGAALGARAGALAACAVGVVIARAPRRAPEGDARSPDHHRDLWEAVAAELRSVAASLAGYQELLLDGTARTADEDLARHLRAIAVQSHRMEVLLANGSTLIGRPQPVAAPAEGGVARAVQASIARAAPHFHAKNLHVQPSIAPGAAGARLDPALAGRIVDNLLLGAVHRSPYGAPLGLRVADEHDGVVICVAYQDTLPLADGPLDRAAEQQAHLGFVRFLADRHGGQAWRRSADHGGQHQLVVWLPAASEA